VCLFLSSGSRDSSVGIATCFGLEGPGIKSQWGEIFHNYPDWLRGPPSLLYNGYRVFPGGKRGRGVMLTTHPFLVPSLRVELYLHSPYGSSWACYGVPITFISFLYMFRVTVCPSSAETTVFMWHLVLVILRGWLSGMQGGIPPCITDSHPHRLTSTKRCINTVVSPDDGHIVAWNV
jgi:hypothetical protein